MKNEKMKKKRTLKTEFAFLLSRKWIFQKQRIRWSIYCQPTRIFL